MSFTVFNFVNSVFGRFLLSVWTAVNQQISEDFLAFNGQGNVESNYSCAQIHKFGDSYELFVTAVKFDSYPLLRKIFKLLNFSTTLTVAKNVPNLIRMSCTSYQKILKNQFFDRCLMSVLATVICSFER